MLTKKRRRKSQLVSVNKKIYRQLSELEDDEGDNFLHLAVIARIDIQTMIKFCEFIGENFGENAINCKNYLQQTPLHIASCVGNELSLIVLLDFEADISCVDRNIENPIHLAVRYGNVNCLEILLSKTKELGFKNNNPINCLNIDGLSPLHLVIESKHECAEQMIKILVKYGANINIRDGLSGRSPLIHCLLNSQNKNNVISKLLITLNADIYLTDYSGFKAIDVMEDQELVKK